LTKIRATYESNTRSFQSSDLKNFGGSGLLSFLTSLVADAFEDWTDQPQSVLPILTYKIILVPTTALLNLMETLGSENKSCGQHLDTADLDTLPLGCLEPWRLVNKLELKLLRKGSNMFLQLHFNQKELQDFVLPSGQSQPYFRFRRWAQEVERARPWVYCQYGIPINRGQAKAKNDRLNQGFIYLGIILSVLVVIRRVWENWGKKKAE
jgi:hypothetical protein